MAKKEQQKNNNLPQLPRFNIFWIYGLIALFIVGWSLLGQKNDKPVEGDWAMVEQLVEQGDVKQIRVVNREQAEVFLVADAEQKYRESEDERLRRLPATGAQILFPIGAVDAFREDMKAVEAVTGERVPIVYVNEKNDWLNIMGSILPWVLIIGVWIFIMRSMSRGGAGGGAGIMNVGKARAQVFDKDNKKRVTFKDVAGLEEAKVEIMEIVDFLKHAEKYRELGAKIPKGALLVGPPGTGKTLLA